MSTYKPLTDKDISCMMRMPTVCDQPCTDIYRNLREKLSDATLLTYITFVYKWGYLQGKRDIADWHGQTKWEKYKQASAKGAAAHAR